MDTAARTRRRRAGRAAVLVLGMVLVAWWAIPVGSEQAGPSSIPTYAFVARADNPVDALAASSVAGQLGGPVYLTFPASLDQEAADGLLATNPDVVVLAGGTTALSETVEQEVTELLPNARILRFAGAGRTETARLLNELAAELGISRPVLVGGTVEGDVGIEGRLTVEGTDVSAALQALSSRVTSLEDQLAQANTTISELVAAVDALEVCTLADHGADAIAITCGDDTATVDLRPPTLTTVDSTASVGQSASLAIGADGNPVISYTDGTHDDLKVAACTDPACTNATRTTVDSAGQVGFFTSLAIGTDGNPVISYHDRTNFDLKVAACTDPACTDATLTTVDSTGIVGTDTSLAIGTDGNPVISYHDRTNFDLKVAACTDPACTNATLTTVDSTGSVGWDPSIAIGDDGNPVISYHDRTERLLRVAACGDPTCTSATSTIVDSTVDAGAFSAITIGADGDPVIGYYDRTNQDLRFAACSDPACTSATLTTVDGAGSVGFFPSVTVGADGNPLISYYDDTHHDLRLAICANPACTAAALSAVDSAGDVGHDTSLAIGTDGNPVIAYHDRTEGDLELARVIR